MLRSKLICLPKFQALLAGSVRLIGWTAIVLMVVLATSLQAEERLWRDNAGKPLMTGDFQSFPDDLVWIVKPDRSRASIPWKQLSQADRQFVMYSVLELKAAEQTAEGTESEPREALPEPTAKALVPSTPPSSSTSASKPAEPTTAPKSDVADSVVQAAAESTEKADEATKEVTVVNVAESPKPSGEAALPQTVPVPQPMETAVKHSAERKTSTTEANSRERDNILYKGPKVAIELKDGSGEIEYERDDKKFTAHLVRKTGLYPAHFNYYESKGTDSKVRSWAIGRDAQAGAQFAVWYEVEAGWKFLDCTKQTKPHVAARPSLNAPLFVAPAKPSAHPTRTLYRGLSSQTSIDPQKIVAADGSAPDLFQYFVVESGHPEIKKWALARKVEHGNLFALWYERAGYWYFFDWTTKEVHRAD